MLEKLFVQSLFPEEGPFVQPMPLALLISVCAVLFIVAIYFVWSKNFAKKSDS